MVTILPPPTSLGNAIGSSVGEGLGRGIERGGQIGFQRNLVQNAFKGLENLPRGANAAQLASQLIQATAGIPGAERYIGQIFPLLLTEMQGRNAPEGQATARDVLGNKKGYLGTAPLTQTQKLDFAKSLTAQGVPIEKGVDIANTLSEGSEAALKHIETNLSKQGVTEKEMPYALQIAQMNESSDPNQVIKNTRLALDEFRQMEKLSTPGAARQAVRAFGGPIGAILAGEPREKVLSRIHPLAKRLREKGYDPIVREYLANIGFSQTEVQEAIRPPTTHFKAEYGKIPPPSKNFAINQERLTNFIKNLRPEDSLLVARQKLWKDKGYDWRQINEAFDEARQQGFIPSEEQDKELAEFSSPPRESLLDIFFDYARPLEYFIGRK